MSNIFFDFDGTIINSQNRLYKLFCELCPENTFSFNEYWNIKRNYITQKEFLKKYFMYSDDKIEIFRKNYLEKVEEPDRMKEDYPVKGIEKIFQELVKKYILYLVTNRQNFDLTINELHQFGWLKYFKEVLVTRQKTTKLELILQKVPVASADIFIGDTGDDIKTAKALGIISVAVTWGVLNGEVLCSYTPDYLISEVDELSFLNL